MKARLTIWLITILTVFSVWINLPPASQIPPKIQVARVKLDLGFLRTEKIEPILFGRRLHLSFLTPNNLLGKFPIKLGLDLEGGTELVLQTKMDKIKSEDRDTALESARQVIEKRVNLYGVSEAVVQTSKLGDQRRILVELPGVKDASAAANLVGKTAQLDFREIPASAAAEASKSGVPAIFYAQPTGLTGADLKKTAVTFGSSGKSTGPEVSIEFTPEGAKKFADITKRNVGKPLAIFLDDTPVSWPTVNQEIIGGSAVIQGNFTPEEAKNLSVQLNAGALPVSIEILQQHFIGATLGNDSIQRSLIAGLIGIVTVMIFMVAFYGLYGLLADLALVIYTLLVLAVFKTGAFILPPVTLTLAGIAGFVLSIGMAVDANILTFERMKEELRSGKTGRMALEAGFKRAWTSIRDSNISSLITATILYIFGTSVVRGFALTLAIGVLVSMFSAIVVTRTFLRLLSRFKR
jgi:preprotein translocase subunit SecD